MRLNEIQGIDREGTPGHWSTSAFRLTVEIFLEIKLLLLKYFHLLLMAVTLMIYGTIISYFICI